MSDTPSLPKSIKGRITKYANAIRREALSESCSYEDRRALNIATRRARWELELMIAKAIKNER